jgi:hypothetical protein
VTFDPSTTQKETPVQLLKSEHPLGGREGEPSIIIAFSSCIAQGYDLVHGLDQQKFAVQSGYWPLMRHNPALRDEGKNSFHLDSKAPSIRLKDYAYREARYSMLAGSNPELAAALLTEAQDDIERQWRVYSGRASARLLLSGECHLFDCAASLGRLLARISRTSRAWVALVVCTWR